MLNKLKSKIATKISAINFEGNIIPHEWYAHVKTESGKTDAIGIMILSEIIFLHRVVRTTKNEKQIYLQRFEGEVLSLNASYFVEKFDFTKEQVRNALKRLEDNKLISREYKTVTKNRVKMNNVMFIKPNVKRIAEITNPIPEELEAETDEEPETPATPKPKSTQQPERRRSVENEKAFQEVLRKFRGGL